MTADSVQSPKAVLKQVDDSVFAYHCNSQKNDFYNWLKDGLGMEDLASKIKKVKTRKGLIRKL